MILPLSAGHVNGKEVGEAVDTDEVACVLACAMLSAVDAVFLSVLPPVPLWADDPADIAVLAGVLWFVEAVDVSRIELEPVEAEDADRTVMVVVTTCVAAVLVWSTVVVVLTKADSVVVCILLVIARGAPPPEPRDLRLRLQCKFG